MKQSQLVFASVIIQRSPLILRPLSAFEKAYSDFIEAFRADKSKGYFEVASDTDDSNTKKSRVFGISAEGASSAKDDEPHGEQTTSLLRSPHRKLYLLLRLDGRWKFPTWQVDDIDSVSSLNDVARKGCSAYTKTNGSLYFTGNSPVAHHTERFADRVAPPFSAIHFFYKAQFVEGHMEIAADDFAWLSAEEIRKIVPAGYWGAVKNVLSY